MLYYIHTENTPVSNANGAAYLAKQAALPGVVHAWVGQILLNCDVFKRVIRPAH